MNLWCWIFFFHPNYIVEDLGKLLGSWKPICTKLRSYKPAVNYWIVKASSSLPEPLGILLSLENLCSWLGLGIKSNGTVLATLKVIIINIPIVIASVIVMESDNSIVCGSHILCCQNCIVMLCPMQTPTAHLAVQCLVWQILFVTAAEVACSTHSLCVACFELSKGWTLQHITPKWQV